MSAGGELHPGPAHGPAFGEASLANCEREQIHLAGSIQPHGMLLVLAGPDLVIRQASLNVTELLGPQTPHGRPLADVLPALVGPIRTRMDQDLAERALAFRWTHGERGAFDVFLHRPASGGLVVELERAGPALAAAELLKAALDRILPRPSLQQLFDEVALVLRGLAGYDRVMVYRFDEEGHGEVVAEERRADLEAFLGNRYPATDIPQIARGLYRRNRSRVLVDVAYEPCPVLPRVDPDTGRELDMSLCVLRSMSPIHIQYLKNMGVGATLVVSLVVGDRLWGLIACHHYAPRAISYELRSICELIGEAVSMRIAALESVMQARVELDVRRMEQRLAEAIAAHGDWRAVLVENPQTLLGAVDATGLALFEDGQVLTAGEVPGTPELRRVQEWVLARGWPDDGVMATAALGSEAPGLRGVADVASGVLAVRLSAAGEMLVWLRPEQVRVVTWGGDPNKAVVIGDDPSTLSPRRSFAQWHQLVEGTSARWTPADLATARLIGESIGNIMLQFRSVRMLIARDQVARVDRLMRDSDQALVITDPRGQVLLVNAPVVAALGEGAAALRYLDELPGLFGNDPALREGVSAALDTRRSWRGEVVRAEEDRSRPFLVQIDCVMTAPERPLGYVVLLADLTLQKDADELRRRLQKRILEHPAPGRDGSWDAERGVPYRVLHSLLSGNARSAALEIADGVERLRIPGLLEGVRDSADRSLRLLEHLLRYGTDDA